MYKSLIKKSKWLYPASWLYGVGVALRNLLFDHGYIPERSFDLPVICIGNITVGGTGKTPHTEYLIRLLQDDFQVAVLSRGYKRKTKGFILADEHSTVHDIGDEPYQMKMKFPKPNPREQSVSLSTSLQHLQSLSVLSALSSPVQSQVRAAQRCPRRLTVQAYFPYLLLLSQLLFQFCLRLS